MRLDCKSVDNCVWRSKPKIKKILEKLGIKPSEFDKTENKLLEIEGVKKIIYTPENISADTNPQLQGFASAIAHGKAAAKEVLKLK